MKDPPAHHSSATVNFGPTDAVECAVAERLRKTSAPSGGAGRHPHTIAAWKFETAQAMLGKSMRVGEVARSTGLTRQTVYRIKGDPVGVEAALTIWGI
jgi:Helix-turn-helix domain of resolvase